MTLFEIIMVALFATFIVVTVVGICLICKEFQKIDSDFHYVDDKMSFMNMEMRTLTNRIIDFTYSLQDLDFKIKVKSDDPLEDDVTVRLKIKDMKKKEH